MQLNQIQTPCLLIHGRDDQICLPESSSFIAERIGGKAQLCILEKAGHIPFYKASALYATYRKISRKGAHL